MNNITVFTDISQRGERIGCGYYIRGNRLLLKGMWRFKAEPNTTRNEIYAICKALELIPKDKPIDMVYIYCDNKGAVEYIQQWTKKKQITVGKIRPNFIERQEWADKLTAFLNKINLPLEIRKVKGHTKGRTTQTYVNNLVDRLSREAHNLFGY